MDMECAKYGVGCLMTVSRELFRYVRVSGSAVALNQQENIHFSIERGMRTMSYVQVFLYIRESYDQLRGLSLFVIRCHT
jgi:hypothetical protein